MMPFALHYSLSARASLRASVTAPLRTSLRWTVRPPALLDGTAEHTKAQVVAPESGVPQLRDAERQKPELMRQLPPRYTRSEPEAGPVGLVTFPLG
jgi:hypothetical protein